MASIESLMSFSELNELSKIPYKRYQDLAPIISKPFTEVTVKEIMVLAGTSIFDHNFTDLLFQDLHKRWLDQKGVNQ